MPAYPSRQPQSLATQAGALRTLWPEGHTQLTKAAVIWTGPLSPTAISREYLVRITYPLDTRIPVVRVLSPGLHALAAGKEIPHLYCQRRLHLCLFTPGQGEWGTHLLLARTLLPWAMLWLYFFEDWLACGEWRGGGTHPRPNNAPRHLK